MHTSGDITGRNKFARCDQLSGGQLQRAMTAMAMICQPDLIVFDEPTTALDVTTQREVLDLLAGLQRQRSMALVLITHDLGVVAEMAHRIAVMYGGQIVEDEARDPMHGRTKGGRTVARVGHDGSVSET